MQDDNHHTRQKAQQIFVDYIAQKIKVNQNEMSNIKESKTETFHMCGAVGIK